MKKYLVLAPFMALSLVVSCQTKSSSTTIYGADDHKIEIIFDAGSGVYDDGLHARSLKVLPGYTWKDIKQVAPNAADIDCGDSIFNEWLLEGATIEDNYSFDQNALLTADYTVIHRMNITVNPGDGHWTDETSTPKTFVAIEGETWGKYYDSYLVEPNDDAKEFKYWTVNDTKITNDHVLQQGDEIVAFYDTKGATTSFVDDPWPIFINALNNGFETVRGSDHAAGGYSPEYAATSFEYRGETISKDENTFVGLKRSVQIGKNTYDAVVIDEDVDPINGHDGFNATLTFQFEQTIENAVGWNSIDDNNYKNSSLRTYLNEQLIDALPDDMIEGLVEVNKWTYSSGFVSSTNEKFFLPSLRELGVTEFTVGQDPYEITVDTKAEGVGDAHGSAYAYYDGAQEGDDYKKQYKGVDCNYWLRSVDFESSGNAWYIDNNGIIGSDEGSYNVRYGLAIAPCFALGAHYEE